MRGSNVLAGGAAFYMGMVLLRNGTLPRLFTKLGDFASTAATGLRPITRVG